jgi:hypothetical protein
MHEVLLFSTVIAPIILALVQVFKQTVIVKNNYVPLIAVVIGIAVGYAAQPFTELGLVSRLWAGGLAGLSATGLFEMVTTTNGYTKGNEESK